MADTWQAVAHALGERLNHATHCDQHRTPDDSCPYCADVAAYARYVAKCGADPARRPMGSSVSIYDLRAVSGEQA